MTGSGGDGGSGQGGSGSGSGSGCDCPDYPWEPAEIDGGSWVEDDWTIRFYYPEKASAEAIPSGVATRPKCLCDETDVRIVITSSDTPALNTYAEVRIDGELVATAATSSAMPITLQPGEYEIEVSAGALAPGVRGGWHWEIQLIWERRR